MADKHKRELATSFNPNGMTSCLGYFIANLVLSFITILFAFDLYSIKFNYENVNANQFNQKVFILIILIFLSQMCNNHEKNARCLAISYIVDLIYICNLFDTIHLNNIMIL